MSCLVSIIIPVYNAEAYIRECLDSVIKQTLKDIEVLCINDKSTDGSLDILREYAAKDDRIRIFDNEVNSGQGYNRNLGLDKASGKYIYTLDADDYLLTDDALKRLCDLAEEYRTDMICFASRSKVEMDNMRESYGFSSEKKGEYPGILTGVESYLKLVENGDYRSPTWLYLYSADFLRRSGIRFLTGIATEDVSFTFDAHMAAKRVLVIKDVLHCYRIVNNSQTHSDRNLYRVKSNGINFRHFISRMDPDNADKEMEAVYNMEYVIETGSWRRRFNECSYEEKREYVGSIKNSILYRFLVNEVLDGNEYILPENVIDDLRSRSIHMYGAGLYAKKYLKLLSDFGLKVDGIIVTKADGLAFYGYKPVQIDEWKAGNDAIIITAVSDQYKKEVIDIIREYTDTECFDIEDYHI